MSEMPAQTGKAKAKAKAELPGQGQPAKGRPPSAAAGGGGANVALRKAVSALPAASPRQTPGQGNEEAKDEENGPSTSHRQPHRSVSEQPVLTSCSPSPAAPLDSQLAGSATRIKRELQEILEHPPPNCDAELTHKDDLYRWTATVIGPEGTPYEFGHFKLDIRFPAAYPFRPPRIRFLSRIYHCNVDSRGSICLDVLNERWSPVMTIAKVLLSIWVLIGECNPDDPLVMGIADQYKCNRREHDRMARYWTKRYAQQPKEEDGSRKKKSTQQLRERKSLMQLLEQDERYGPSINEPRPALALAEPIESALAKSEDDARAHRSKSMMQLPPPCAEDSSEN